MIGGMEAVEGMLGKMKLMEEERKEVRVKVVTGGRATSADPQAIGKVLSDKSVNAEGLAQALGRMWCPMRGIIMCKDLGNNHFLITFHLPPGKRRALEDGPWVFGKDLIIVVEFDGMKQLEDVKFETILI